MTAEEFIINEEKLAGAVKYSLCWKRTHPGSNKRYPYIKYPGGQWEYVPEEKRAEVEEGWEEKCRLKEERQRLRAELKAMTRAERKDFRQRVKLLKIVQSIKMDCPFSQMPNGEPRDSKSEVILNCVVKHLGLDYEYNPDFYAVGRRYKPDFVINDIIWEHRGVFDDPQYERRHRQKLFDYEVDSVNYVVTEDRLVPGSNRGHLKLPEILWTMVRTGMVSAAKVLKTYYSGY